MSAKSSILTVTLSLLQLAYFVTLQFALFPLAKTAVALQVLREIMDRIPCTLDRHGRRKHGVACKGMFVTAESLAADRGCLASAPEGATKIPRHGAGGKGCGGWM